MAQVIENKQKNFPWLGTVRFRHNTRPMRNDAMPADHPWESRQRRAGGKNRGRGASLLSRACAWPENYFGPKNCFGPIFFATAERSAPCRSVCLPSTIRCPPHAIDLMNFGGSVVHSKGLSMQSLTGADLWPAAMSRTMEPSSRATSTPQSWRPNPCRSPSSP